MVIKIGYCHIFELRKMKKTIMTAMTVLMLAAMATSEASASETVSAPEEKITKERERIESGYNYQNSGLYAGAIDALNRLLIAERHRKHTEKLIGEYTAAIYSPHAGINEAIYFVRNDRSLSDRKKLKKTAEILADNINEVKIAYGHLKGPFGWTVLKDEKVAAGETYHDGLIMDCSDFVQWAYYGATGKMTAPNTELMCYHADWTEPKPGTVAFHYDAKTQGNLGDNHCAIWLGDGRFIESSSGYGAVRVNETNEFYDQFFTKFADLEPDPLYYGDIHEYDFLSN